ncbi:MAG: SGNH/GDSL hydrolase family protein [Patescibacteria group bacterium]
MNTNLNTIKILCYGDSNTWGQDPTQRGTRHPVTVRWTGLLQEKLGDNYWIIEEGLSGRTTVLDGDPREGKNGKTYLKPCLETHNPIDIVILMLGTNDLKEMFHQSPQDIANNVEVLVKMIQEFGWNSNKQAPKIVLLSPPFVDESVPGVQEKYKGAEEKSKELGEYYQQVAEKYACTFINIAEHISPSKSDGYHLDPDAHKSISEILEKTVKDIAK